MMNYDDPRPIQSGMPPQLKAVDTIDMLILLIRDLMADLDRAEEHIRNLHESHQSGSESDHKRAEGIRREVDEWRNRRKETKPTPIGAVNRVRYPDE